MAKNEKAPESKDVRSNPATSATVPTPPVAPAATAEKAVADAPKEELAAAEGSRAAKKGSFGKLKGKTEVKNLVSHLREVLPEGSAVNVALPINEYNAFVDANAKQIEDAKDETLTAGSDLVTTISEKGITVTIRAIFA